jgi:hypothetical protein
MDKKEKKLFIHVFTKNLEIHLYNEIPVNRLILRFVALYNLVALIVKLCIVALDK